MTVPKLSEILRALGSGVLYGVEPVVYSIFTILVNLNICPESLVNTFNKKYHSHSTQRCMHTAV